MTSLRINVVVFSCTTSLMYCCLSSENNLTISFAFKSPHWSVTWSYLFCLGLNLSNTGAYPNVHCFIHFWINSWRAVITAELYCKLQYLRGCWKLGLKQYNWYLSSHVIQFTSCISEMHWYHVKIISHSPGFLWIQVHEINREKTSR